ncbi:MAG: hypothetical protein V8S13_09315 [Gemmiger formicilis]
MVNNRSTDGTEAAVQDWTPPSQPDCAGAAARATTDNYGSGRQP